MSSRCPNCSAMNPDGSRFCAQCATPISQSGSSGALPTVTPSSAFLPRGPFSMGKYQLNRALGQGAMGVVYEALDTYIGRRVALKTIRLEVALTEARQQSLSRRLAREARAAGRLLHPNIVLIYEAGELDNLNYIAMELVEGHTLAELLNRGGPLLRPRAIGLALQIARALGYAHDSQIIHRDIKPSNILLTEQDQVKVTDFGLAKVLWESASLTRDGGTVGTPAYMSPEQIAGKADDGRSDLFSLAVLFYQCLTGFVPFSARNVPALMYQILEGVPRPLPFEDPKLLRAYTEFFDRALAKDPVSRFPDAASFAVDLEKLATLESEQPASAPAPGPKNVRLGSAASRSDDATLELAADRIEIPVPRPTKTVAPRRSVVAVLGLHNLSALVDVAWLGVILGDYLIAELEAAEDRGPQEGTALQVLSPESVARMRRELELPYPDPLGAQSPGPLRKATLARIRKNLGADYVVYGSYLALGEKARGQFRLDLQLKATATGKALGTVSRSATENELQDLVRQTAAELREMLEARPISVHEHEAAQSSLPTRPDALRCTGEGLLRLRLYDALGALEPLQKAALAEPGHPAIRLALSQVWSLLGHPTRAREEARRAYELSSHLPRESAMRIEARHRRLGGESLKAQEIYRRLWADRTDRLEYGLELTEVQLESGQLHEALATVFALRRSQGQALADPRIDLLEAEAAERLGDTRRQKASAKRAAEAALARESPMLQATARLCEARAMAALGELDAALTACAEARRLSNAFGDRRGHARALQALAEIQARQQNLSEARRTLEEMLGLGRDVGEKSLICSALAEIGLVLQKQGNLDGARKRLEEASSQYRELNDKTGLAKALAGLAGIAGQMGDLAGARKMHEEALVIARESGDEKLWGESLLCVGKILLARDNLFEAQRRLQEALELQERRGQDHDAARCRRALAELDLETGRLQEAEIEAREVATQFHEEGSLADEVQALSVLGRILLAQHRPQDACTVMERALGLGEALQDHHVRTALRITAATVQGLAAPHQLQAAQRTLESAFSAARKAGLIGLQLEARMALAQLELRSARPAGARTKLEILEKEASARGHGLLARKAAALL